MHIPIKKDFQLIQMERTDWQQEKHDMFPHEVDPSYEQRLLDVADGAFNTSFPKHLILCFAGMES